MTTTLVSIAFSPDFSGEGSSAVSIFLQGSCSAQYSEQCHPWGQRVRKLRSSVLLLRDTYHCLKASDSSSISHVLPDWRAASPKTPRFAAFSKVERSIDRSTEISRMVLCIGLTNRLPVVRLRNRLRQGLDNGYRHPVNTAGDDTIGIDRIADIVDDDSGFAVVAGVLCLFECHCLDLTFFISYQLGILNYIPQLRKSQVFSLPISAMSENSLKGGVYG